MAESSITRLFRIASVLKRHGLDEFFHTQPSLNKFGMVFKFIPGRPLNDDRSRGLRLREALQDLGPVFIKFGQMLSTRPDLLPEDIAKELTLLQDQVPPFESEIAKQIIRDTYDDRLQHIFSEFDENPIASASVAQVHYAHLKEEDEEVVIKILRPGIKEVIDRDINLLYTLAGLMQKYWSEGERLKPLEVVEEYDKTIHDELDLMREAANASQLRSNFEKSPIIYVPKVYFDYTTTNVMVMERIHGTPIRDIEALKAKGIDMRTLGHNGVEIFFTQAFRDGFFHADMHPGNIFVADDGQYQAVDFGIMGSLSDEDKHYLAVNLLCFFNRDYRGVAKAHVESGWVPPETRVEEFEAAIRTVCEPIFDKPISEISFGKFVMKLFQTARRFKMPVQPQLVLLQKTLLNIEGLGRQLYPDLDLWETAKPFLENWMKDQYGPKAAVDAIKREAPKWSVLLPELPVLAHQAMTAIRQQNGSLQQAQDEIQLLKEEIKKTKRKQLFTLIVLLSIGLIYFLVS